MPKFKVSYTQTVEGTMTVDAASEDEAKSHVENYAWRQQQRIESELDEAYTIQMENIGPFEAHTVELVGE